MIDSFDPPDIQKLSYKLWTSIILFVWVVWTKKTKIWAVIPKADSPLPPSVLSRSGAIEVTPVNYVDQVRPSHLLLIWPDHSWCQPVYLSLHSFNVWCTKSWAGFRFGDAGSSRWGHLVCEAQKQHTAAPSGDMWFAASLGWTRSMLPFMHGSVSSLSSVLEPVPPVSSLPEVMPVSEQYCSFRGSYNFCISLFVLLEMANILMQSAPPYARPCGPCHVIFQRRVQAGYRVERMKIPTEKHVYFIQFPGMQGTAKLHERSEFQKHPWRPWRPCKEMDPLTFTRSWLFAESKRRAVRSWE